MSKEHNVKFYCEVCGWLEEPKQVFSHYLKMKIEDYYGKHGSEYIQMLVDGVIEEVPLGYWEAFAEEMYSKALEHLKEHPEDKFDAWNDSSKDDEFWFKRLEEELQELKDAKDKEEQIDELLDVANICLFIWYRRRREE